MNLKTNLLRKPLLLSLVGLSICGVASAQSSGKISYQESMKLELNIDGNADEATLNSLPKEHTTFKELLFTEEASLYQNSKSNTKEEEEHTDEAGGKMIIKMKIPDNQVYVDLKSNLKLEKNDFMSRLFLIEGSTSDQKWKLSGNQKTILNYPCQEAILLDTTKHLKVWFTPSITQKIGPNGYGNLPGAILAAELDNGRIKIEATAIEFKKIEAGSIYKPKEGKKVSKEEFEKIRREKLKEMNMENGGKGNVIIKIRD
jgi:GLPGLI family protein